MRRLADALYQIILTWWVGGLWTVGFVVAPMLFSTLAGNRPLAGALAGRLFELIGWIGLACACYLLPYLLFRLRSTTFKRWHFWLVVVMTLLTAVSLFGIQPLLAELKTDALPREVMESVLRDRFATWHGISSGLYVLQSVLGLLLISGVLRGGR
ncbi:MAG TPA: DUF4149 domain-containing protein [Accumulibacter sp.]|nr:DUF4149 domain-containing protein [Accumulibacter sp.]HMW18007.1 DUF4149 domain-containing protein [Accumulibacter sp.]HMX23326.1 DUF4149 domain-containing protein [Accumulibacter sp.]HMY07781.1 DUF4149 domain-containing protein [Accumulibacter sp.]HNC17595.1 DUF4149 domain-containing protein [Accumulibacter sp.]